MQNVNDVKSIMLTPCQHHVNKLICSFPHKTVFYFLYKTWHVSWWVEFDFEWIQPGVIDHASVACILKCSLQSIKQS